MMNIFKLARLKHDKNYVDNIVDKCCSILISCKTTDQLYNALECIKFSYDFILKKEHHDEYTKQKLWLCKLIDKENNHEAFFKSVEDSFNLLKMNFNNMIKKLNRN